MSYWIDCVSDILHEQGISATVEQIAAIARDMQLCAEGESMMHAPVANPLEAELRATQNALAAERGKVICPECRGIGSETIQGPYHHTVSQCWGCCGEGRVKG